MVFSVCRCGEQGYPGVYADVRRYVTWIADVMSRYAPDTSTSNANNHENNENADMQYIYYYY